MPEANRSPPATASPSRHLTRRALDEPPGDNGCAGRVGSTVGDGPRGLLRPLLSSARHSSAPDPDQRPDRARPPRLLGSQLFVLWPELLFRQLLWPELCRARLPVPALSQPRALLLHTHGGLHAGILQLLLHAGILPLLTLGRDAD